jgi:short-subunit dehydrogenase
MPKASQCKAIASALEETGIEVGVLVNNAGVIFEGKTPSTSKSSPYRGLNF